MAILSLLPTIQHYAWGGNQFLPEILDLKNHDTNLPFAELWMGSHPKSPSRLEVESKNNLLSDWIKKDPINILGRNTANQFDNQLPFLFKILDVKKMLSIQVHPSKSAAEIGFAKENEMGIPIDASNRNYKDRNHKPEIMLALTDFWLLHGFMTKQKIEAALINTPEFKILSDFLEKQNDIGLLYQFIMKMPQLQVNNILLPLKIRLFNGQNAAKDHPDYWAKSAFTDYTQAGNFDRGIFSIYIFNLLQLKKGEVIFQGRGMPHAYLEGVNVELMANSDNVFRGGLTPKHIDINELLANTSCQATIPNILKGEEIKENWVAYKTPAPDFELSKIQLDKSKTLNIPAQTGPAIYLVLEGRIQTGNQTYEKGKSFWVDNDTSIHLQGEGVIYRAGMPMVDK